MSQIIKNLERKMSMKALATIYTIFFIAVIIKMGYLKLLKATVCARDAKYR
jgi:hypothetical protein